MERERRAGPSRTRGPHSDSGPSASGSTAISPVLEPEASTGSEFLGPIGRRSAEIVLDERRDCTGAGRREIGG